jgi:hypothetical protein
MISMDNTQQVINAPVLIQSITERDILQDRILLHINGLERQIAQDTEHPSEMSELLRPALMALLESRKRMLEHLKEFSLQDEQQNRVA